MDFCQHCDNMMYVKLDEEKNLVLYCKNCGYETKKMRNQGSYPLIHDNRIDDETRYSQAINKNIVFDPTLPHVNNIDCPNKNCSKGEKEENDVIYMKYDSNNMKYLYLCAHCNSSWKSE